MPSKFQHAVDRNLLTINADQKWIKDNLHYEVIMGSQAYGVSHDTSDMDIYGWCIPPKLWVFPHLTGYIDGFGPKPQRFDQFQLHAVKDADKQIEYDFTIYSVVKYMDLVAENNPNMIDSLFVPVHCVTHQTQIGAMIRDHRRQFLHRGAFHKFKGYAYSQIHKIRTKQTHDNMSTKRRESIEKYGYDVKFAYHCIRLLDECEQILIHQDIDLQRNREQLKAIRRGEWQLEYLIEWFEQKEKQLEQLYLDSKLPDRPDHKMLNKLLIDVLEAHYGSLSEVVKYDRSEQLLFELQQLVRKYQP